RNQSCHRLPCVSRAISMSFSCKIFTRSAICLYKPGLPPESVTWEKRSPPWALSFFQISKAVIWTISSFTDPSHVNLESHHAHELSQPAARTNIVFFPIPTPSPCLVGPNISITGIIFILHPLPSLFCICSWFLIQPYNLAL